MKKKLSIIYVVVFFALCICPLVMILFSPQSERIGNEQSADMPKFITGEGINRTFSTEFDECFSKINPLRKILINAENSLKIDVFNSNSNGVIAGNNGYLFSEETTDDYIGVTMSDRAIYRAAKTIELTQKYAESNGSNFVFTVVPNKNSVYPELMPSRFIKGDKNNLDNLAVQLKKLGVNYMDLKSYFLDIDTELYLKEDTHWNNLGALYGFNSIMDKLGKDHKTYNGVSYKIKKDFKGDLADMAFPDSVRTCEQYYFDIYPDDYIFLQPGRSSDKEELLKTLMGNEEKIDGIIRTSNSKAEGSLYILRDSFGRALLPFLIDNYVSTYITRYQPINLTQSSYDDIVWEVVERNISDILNTAPAVYAQSANVIADKIQTSRRNQVKISDNGTTVSIYGELDKRYFDTESNIYAFLTGDNDYYCFEAFPVFESEKIGVDRDSDYGFSLTINKDSINQGNYGIGFIISNGDSNISTAIINYINIKRE